MMNLLQSAMKLKYAKKVLTIIGIIAGHALLHHLGIGELAPILEFFL